MALNSILYNRIIDNYTLENARQALERFLNLIDSIRHKFPEAQKLMELLYPGYRILEIYCNKEASIKEIVEVAYYDFLEANELIGEIISVNCKERG